MSSARSRFLLLFALAAGGCWWVLWRQHAGRELAAERAALLEANERILQRRQEQQHPTGATALARGEQEVEVARLRQQIAGAERSEAAITIDNRDPEKGLVKVEHFRPVGRATPSAAFQTAIWASLQNDEELAATMAVHPELRRRTEAFIAALPQNLRPDTLTPERLFATSFARDILRKAVSAQVLEVIPQDERRVILVGRLLMFDERVSDARLPLELGPTGWQLVVPDRLLGSIEQSLSRGTP